MRDVKCSMEQYSRVRVELNFSCMRTALSYGTKRFGHSVAAIQGAAVIEKSVEKYNAGSLCC